MQIEMTRADLKRILVLATQGAHEDGDGLYRSVEEGAQNGDKEDQKSILALMHFEDALRR